MVMVWIGHATGYHLVVVSKGGLVVGGGDGKGCGQAMGLRGDGRPGGRDRAVVRQGAGNSLSGQECRYICVKLTTYAPYMSTYSNIIMFNAMLTTHETYRAYMYILHKKLSPTFFSAADNFFPSSRNCKKKEYQSYIISYTNAYMYMYNV